MKISINPAGECIPVIRSASELSELIDQLENLLKGYHGLGIWLSAALEDEEVSQEMKTDIQSWFSSVSELRLAIERMKKFLPDQRMIRDQDNDRYSEAFSEF